MARRALRDALASWDLGHLAENATLLVSELVGNSVRHARAGGAPLQLSAEAGENTLRIEVRDSDPRVPAMRTPSEFDEGGFGLVLVQALADNWGVRRTDDGKAVWLELRNPAEPAKRGNAPPPDDGRRKPETEMSADDLMRPKPSSGSNGLDFLRPNVTPIMDYCLGGKQLQPQLPRR